MGLSKKWLTEVTFVVVCLHICRDCLSTCQPLPHVMLSSAVEMVSINLSKKNEFVILPLMVYYVIMSLTVLMK